MRSIPISIFSVVLVGSSLINATFPSAPMATQALEIEERPSINATESAAVGRFGDQEPACQAILVSSTDDVLCAKRGAITSRGIVPINMWPRQSLHESASDCALYCESRVGSLYQSFGIQAKLSNMTTAGYECSCYDAGVGALKLAGCATGFFYDSACFLFEC